MANAGGELRETEYERRSKERSHKIELALKKKLDDVKKKIKSSEKELREVNEKIDKHNKKVDENEKKKREQQAENLKNDEYRLKLEAATKNKESNKLTEIGGKTTKENIEEESKKNIQRTKKETQSKIKNIDEKKNELGEPYVNAEKARLQQIQKQIEEDIKSQAEFKKFLFATIEAINKKDDKTALGEYQKQVNECNKKNPNNEKEVPDSIEKALFQINGEIKAAPTNKKKNEIDSKELERDRRLFKQDGEKSSSEIEKLWLKKQEIENQIKENRYGVSKGW